MLAAGTQPVARRADVNRPAEPANVLKRSQRPRRAATALSQQQATGARKTAVGIAAGAALVGGLGLVTAQPAEAAPIGYGLPKLGRHDTGKAVTRLQRELSAYGPNVPDTGYYGKKTAKRVKRVQRKHGWKQTGVAGNRVWHALLTDGNKVTAPKLSTFSHTGTSGHKKKSTAKHPRLHRGNSGKAVKRLQRQLGKYGPSVPVTGYFGNITRARVRNLQKREDLKVTGVANKSVWKVLTTDDNVPYQKAHKKKSHTSTHKKSAHKKTSHKKIGQVESASVKSKNTVWDKLAKCEAGGNWSINTGNGFYGGLQFTLQTWHAYGGSGMPNHASRAQQIKVGQKVRSGQGWGAWPACSSKLGLR